MKIEKLGGEMPAILAGKTREKVVGMLMRWKMDGQRKRLKEVSKAGKGQKTVQGTDSMADETPRP
jgi:hypothetical protein